MEEIRLQKYMADCGVDSRRKCEQIILDGKVKVNGQYLSSDHNYWAAQYYTTNQFAYDYCWWQ